MRIMIILVALSVAFAGPAWSHGGGCRKDSPPGKCCHKDNSKGGRVHCH